MYVLYALLYACCSNGSVMWHLQKIAACSNSLNMFLPNLPRKVESAVTDGVPNVFGSV